MRAKIKSIYSSDVDVENFVPSDPEDFSVPIRILVGPADQAGEESFDILLCTPRWVARHIDENGPMVGRHHILVNSYNLFSLRHFLEKLIESQTAPTWAELGERIGRIGTWEFEDYEPYRES